MGQGHACASPWQVRTRLALARRYLYPMLLWRVWARSNGDERRSTSMALSIAMRAVARLTLLLAVVSTRRGATLAPGAQASAMPRRLYAERRLLHPAVAQRAAVDRKAWIGTTKPAGSEKSRAAITIRAIRVVGWANGAKTRPLQSSKSGAPLPTRWMCIDAWAKSCASDARRRYAADFAHPTQEALVLRR